MTRGFLSDNASGVHPRVLVALAEANDGHAAAYGNDPWTAQLEERVLDLFGPDAAVFPVFNGTGANVLAAQVLLEPWEALLATSESHMVNDESTAPQRMGGTRIITVPHRAGKATPDGVRSVLDGYDGTVHRPRPAAVSIAQATELGTIYHREELTALRDLAGEHRVRVHVDGARLANAAVRLGVGLAEAAAGADVVSFGGTKNGLLGAEAVIALDPEVGQRVQWLRKASAQLASKMRFLSAQLLALLDGELWRRNAEQANAAADLLVARLADLGIQPRYPVEANAVFIPVPDGTASEAAAQAPVHPWDVSTVRAVASFDTTEDDVDALVAALRPHLAGG